MSGPCDGFRVVATAHGLVGGSGGKTHRSHDAAPDAVSTARRVARRVTTARIGWGRMDECIPPSLIPAPAGEPACARRARTPERPADQGVGRGRQPAMDGRFRRHRAMDGRATDAALDRAATDAPVIDTAVIDAPVIDTAVLGTAPALDAPRPANSGRRSCPALRTRVGSRFPPPGAAESASAVRPPPAPRPGPASAPPAPPYQPAPRGSHLPPYSEPFGTPAGHPPGQRSRARPAASRASRRRPRAPAHAN